MPYVTLLQLAEMPGALELAQVASDKHQRPVAAELTGMHAQTLRTYDRLGIVTPERTSGGGRRYSLRDVAMLREVQRLSQEEGVNLAGIKSIIELTEERDRLEAERDALAEEVRALREQAAGRRPQRSGELVHVPRSTSVVMWSPRTARERKRSRGRGYSQD